MRQLNPLNKLKVAINRKDTVITCPSCNGVTGCCSYCYTEGTVDLNRYYWYYQGSRDYASELKAWRTLYLLNLDLLSKNYFDFRSVRPRGDSLSAGIASSIYYNRPSWFYDPYLISEPVTMTTINSASQLKYVEEIKKQLDEYQRKFVW